MKFLHKAFGHRGLETLKNTAKMYGFKFSGKFKTCGGCPIAKAGQKKASTIPVTSQENDISSIQPQRSFGGAKFLFPVVVDCTDY
jgi:hypothetical protein